LNPDNIRPRRLNIEQLHLLLGKQNPDNARLIEEFNKGLKKLKASGQIEVFMREALGPD
jgi:polar amino acid transport system substrate-binding protein